MFVIYFLRNNYRDISIEMVKLTRSIYIHIYDIDTQEIRFFFVLCANKYFGI